MKCRVFKSHIVWSYGLFFFPTNISFKEIKSAPYTRYIQKDNYVGEFEFDEKFLNMFQTNKINDKIYFYENILEQENYYIQEWNRENKEHEELTKHKKITAEDFVSDIPESLF
jgi:deoxyhypusine synthase